MRLEIGLKLERILLSMEGFFRRGSNWALYCTDGKHPSRKERLHRLEIAVDSVSEQCIKTWLGKESRGEGFELAMSLLISEGVTSSKLVKRGESFDLQ